MPITAAQIHQALDEANASLARGNAARADLICQSVLAQGVRSADAVFLAGRVAAAIGEFTAARKYFDETKTLHPFHPFVVPEIEKLDLLESRAHAPQANIAQ